jgi:high affinity Mn2+ porin
MPIDRHRPRYLCHLRHVRRLYPLVILACMFAIIAMPAVVGAQEATEDAAPKTVLDHPDARWWLSGQINVIEQSHPTFTSPYSGPHSLQADAETRVSRVLTLFTGLKLGRGWEVSVDIESAGGRGLSDAFGVAGFTNLDVVRNPSLGTAPYLARAMVRKVIALSSDEVEVERGPFALASRLPSRRIEIRAGKLGMVDFFDANAVGSDSHLQFTNWTIDNNGAYDYAADTRGYTVGVIVEYITPRWTLRGAEALMPTVANGIDLDQHVDRARGENLELELRPTNALTLRLLGYVNHANMGSYTDAIQAFRDGHDPTPDIESHRKHGRIKQGVGANVEYAVPGTPVRLFGRTGWNDGDSESYAYTEVNNTVSAGADIAGVRWHRPDDRLGAAFVSNGLSAPHREYLRLGGLGFLLGDGTLNYGREQIVETYYTAHLWRGLFASVGAQFLAHPGYNTDRGPVFVQMARVHVDF